MDVKVATTDWKKLDRKLCFDFGGACCTILGQ
jgi:hypothetical protein